MTNRGPAAEYIARCRFTFCPLRPGGTCGVLNLRLAVKRGVDRNDGCMTLRCQSLCHWAPAPSSAPPLPPNSQLLPLFKKLPPPCVTFFVFSFPTPSGLRGWHAKPSSPYRYTDSPDGDWVIGHFPGDSGLFLATSGSGHAFKFLPNIGRVVVDILRGRADSTTKARFAVDRDISRALNAERVDNCPQELLPEELCGPEDMLPYVK